MTAGNLDGRLIAAVPVPFDRAGRIDRDAQARYASHLAGQGVGGAAVLAHTGRGLRLTPAQRAEVLTDWSSALGGRAVLVAAAGAPAGVTGREAAFGAARAMADQAAELGAHALLVHPPAFARGRDDRDRLILDYHDAVARSGLPLLLFYLYEDAGGVAYEPGVLSELLARPEVVGIKVATLDSVMTYQQVARLVRDRFPDKVLITGEDRFLGYSLMCGARSALIGMAAAWTATQAALVASYWGNDPARFLALNGSVDEFAQLTFVPPMEGYIQRLLWCLVHEGVIPLSSANDPWSPPLPPDEFDRIGEALRRLRER